MPGPAIRGALPATWAANASSPQSERANSEHSLPIAPILRHAQTHTLAVAGRYTRVNLGA